MERFNSSVYDWRMSLDERCVWALRKLGISPGEIHGQNGRLKGAVFTFSLLFGDREQAKQRVIDFLEDEYGAENVQFFANPKKPTECYAKFDFNRRKAANEKSDN